jgi:hypothetical protein
MRSGGILVVIAAVAAAALFAAGSPLVSADKVNVYYDYNPDISVGFPVGENIERGGTLVIDLYSEVYDMEKSGIMFYAVDARGNYDPVTSVITPYNLTVTEDGTVKRIFINLAQDIRINFSDLVDLEAQTVLDGSEEDTAWEDAFTMTVLFASMIASIVMLIVMRWMTWKFDSLLKDAEGTA